MKIKDTIILKIAKRWIAGTSLEDVIKCAKKANSSGIKAVVNYLGEDIEEDSVAEQHKNEYIRLQNVMESEKINGCVSLKLTQIGLLKDAEKAKQRLESIIINGESKKQYVWIDMESSKFTDETIKIYLDLAKTHSRTGIALQAYLKRTEEDIEKIIQSNGMIRLVKGAYHENKDIVITGRERIRKNYLKLMERLFGSGIYFAVATHDQFLIDKAISLATDKSKFEFEFLKGIRDEIKKKLVSEGYNVAEYIPYGQNWYPYSIRRIEEHPSNIILLLRSIIGF